MNEDEMKAPQAVVHQTVSMRFAGSPKAILECFTGTIPEAGQIFALKVVEVQRENGEIAVDLNFVLVDVREKEPELYAPMRTAYKGH